MNKAVTPTQLDLTAGKTRSELLIQALPSHIDPESPAFKADLAKVVAIENQEAARAVLGAGGFAFGCRADLSDDDFNWNDDDAIILKEQRATAAYRNKARELIIRQRASWDEEQDTFVYISPENEVAFLEGLAKRARE